MIILILFTCLFLNLKSDQGKQELLDDIIVYIPNESGTQFVCRSDGWFLNPMGMPVGLEQYILRSLWVAHAEKIGIKSKIQDGMSEYIERYLDNLQENKNVTRKTLEEMCKEIGYTMLDLKQELGLQYLVQQTIEVTLTAKGFLHVSSDEISEYYETHKQTIPEYYTLRKGIKKTNEIIWSDAFKTKKCDLSPLFQDISPNDKERIFETESRANDDGMIIYQMVEYQPESVIPLDDQYDQISKIIQDQKYHKGYLLTSLELLEEPSLEWNDKEFKTKIKEELEQAMSK
jgi:hypothetical protein